MTANGSAIMTNPSPAQPRWRLAWAERENERRRRAYTMQDEAWRRRGDELTRLQIEAVGFLGYLQPRTGLPVDLDDDEVVYRVLPAAELVEAKARHVPGLPAPGLAVSPVAIDAPGRALPTGLRVVDTGMAVVTNRRVAFSGHHRRREWTYEDMMGPAHYPDVPLTLLHTTDGGHLAGLLVPASATVNFRFYLTLAFAVATGERTAVTAQIDALLAAHRKTRPAPPRPAGSDHAPPAPVRSNRLVAAAAALVAFACAALTAGTTRPEPDRLPYRAQPSSTGVPTGAAAPGSIGGAIPSSSATLVAPDGATGVPVAILATGMAGGGPAWKGRMSTGTGSGTAPDLDP